MALDHLGLSDLFMRCIYSWAFTVSWKIKLFMWPVWIFTSLVTLVVIIQSYRFGAPMWMSVRGGGCLTVRLYGGYMISMISWTLRRMALVLYLWTGGMWMGLPSYWFFGGGMVLVSSGMTRCAFWGVCPAAWIGLIVIGTQLLTLGSGAGNGYINASVVGCWVCTDLGSGKGVCYTPVIGNSGVCVKYDSATLNMDSRWRRAAVCLYPRCGIGLVGVIFCWASVRSAAVFITALAGERFGSYALTGKNPVMSDKRSDAVLGM